jgi:hypothetical protein
VDIDQRDQFTMLAGLRKKCVQTRGAYAGSVAADCSTMGSDEWAGCDRVISQSWTPSMPGIW